MPCQKFKCQGCFGTISKIVSGDVTTLPCPKCSDEMHVTFASSSGTEVTECVGKYWNKNLRVGLKEDMTKRSEEHMRKHEIHDIIAKFGIDNLQNHPLIKNKSIRKAGE